MANAPSVAAPSVAAPSVAAPSVQSVAEKQKELIADNIFEDSR